MNNAEIDAYLARCVAGILRAQPVPEWPANLSQSAEAAAARIAFHGIALLIAQAPGALASWPDTLAFAVREQAGIQTFWEHGHRAAIAGLLDALAGQGIKALVTKGTALAYSLYPDPAIRRRGDTDIFLPGADRRQVRKVLRACGFWEAGDTKALQESWQCATALGFEPAVDIHWRINASAAVSRVLETGLRFEETIALEGLSSKARAIGPVDNLILTAINRSAHGQFGYNSGKDRLFESDRLIWAVDTHLLAGSFGGTDWDALTERCARTGTAAIVGDSLAFAERALGTRVPGMVTEALVRAPANHGLAAYYGSSSHLWRLRQDVAGCTSPAEAVRVLRYVALPSEDFLETRFPDASGWPRAALHLRRWLEGAGKLLTGKI